MVLYNSSFIRGGGLKKREESLTGQMVRVAIATLDVVHARPFRDHNNNAKTAYKEGSL
ncbi:hypothetical protein GGQ73_001956 [Rhizobium skierniewicense]|uniref:Uncharacterized protein n=1 Tax=Rhizobium skierniewicense TaxID=984260 RepID=A0A7W6G1R7_9HYPH|nr:hypothetical protein [Rhizobium skierniewicense]